MWLWVAMCVEIWLCVAMCGYVQVRVGMYSYGWLCVAMCSYEWLWLAICSHVQLWVALGGYVQLLVAIGSYGWLWMAICCYGCYWWLCMAICCYGWQCVSTCEAVSGYFHYGSEPFLHILNGQCQQTAYKLRSVNLFTLRTQLYSGICIVWWLQLIHFISWLKVIIGEQRLREKQLAGNETSVVVDSLSQVIFLFLLFLGMLISYANGLKQKKNNICVRKN